MRLAFARSLPLMSLAAALACIIAISAHGENAASAIAIVPVTSHQLPHVPGKSVTLVRVTFPPGAKDGAHRHAGAVTVYLLAGTIKSQINDGPVTTYKAGDSFFEPPGVTHTMVENPSSTEPAELLAIFVADDGAELTTPVR